jgi:hypothetical protein
MYIYIYIYIPGLSAEDPRMNGTPVVINTSSTQIVVSNIIIQYHDPRTLEKWLIFLL